MKYDQALGLVCAFAIAIVLNTLPQALAQSPTISGIASVIDGDTIEIHGERIRLGGFDAPESGARCGRSNVHNLAANALADHIASRTVTCTITGRDAYGRTTADCSVDSVDLGDHLVSAGWARDWPRYSSGRYASAEAQARCACRHLGHELSRQSLGQSRLLGYHHPTCTRPASAAQRARLRHREHPQGPRRRGR